MSEPYDPGRVKQVAGYGGYCVQYILYCIVHTCCFSSRFGLIQKYYAISLAVCIRFLVSISFPMRIPNCSIAKTREAKAKTRHKVKNDGKGGV